MNILAFDTSTTACAVALQHGDQVTETHTIQPREQARLILPIIQDLLDKSSLTLNQLDVIAYGAGPGSFTGTRIASSVAQGLGFAANLPVIPISSLAAAAQAAWQEHRWDKVVIAVDARMNELYWALYEINATGFMTLTGQEVVSTVDAVQLPQLDAYVAIGDGWINYQDKLIAQLGKPPTVINTAQTPTAAAILALARTKYEQKDWLLASQAVPNYLR